MHSFDFCKTQKIVIMTIKGVDILRGLWYTEYVGAAMPPLLFYSVFALEAFLRVIK